MKIFQTFPAINDLQCVPFELEVPSCIVLYLPWAVLVLSTNQLSSLQITW